VAAALSIAPSCPAESSFTFLIGAGSNDGSVGPTLSSSEFLVSVAAALSIAHSCPTESSFTFLIEAGGNDGSGRKRIKT
jgi:hypothetical protein